MSEVKFEDYTLKVIDAMEKNISAVLEECAGELEAQTVQNSRTKSYKTKTSFKHKVIDSEKTAYIGSNYINAIWEEFGTGEYALKGNGRSGYWVYVAGSEPKENSSTPGKSYTLKEAKRIVAMLRAKGLDAYYTKGKKPSRAFWNAYNSLKNPIINRIQNSFKDL